MMMDQQEDDDPARKNPMGKSRPTRAKKSRKSSPTHRGSGGQEPASGGAPAPSEPKDAGEEGRGPEGPDSEPPSISGEEGPPANPYPPDE
jgi:hypothetical protein